MRSFAKLSIWLFFLLIFSNAVVITAAKYGDLPGRPIYYYAPIAAGLLIAAALSDGLRDLLNEKLFFGVLIGLAVIGLLMYRGDAGPDFGGKVSYPLYVPSRIGTAIWPILNLASAAALYVFARNQKHRPTILCAAFATLALLALTMEADLWWPGIFGDPNGRAAGLAQNANSAALLLVVLASFFLPFGKGERSNFAASYVVLIAFAAVLFTQSKTGLAMAGILVASFALAKKQGSSGGLPRLGFVAAYLAVLLVTVSLSPVLHGTVPFPKPMINGVQLAGVSEPVAANQSLPSPTPTPTPSAPRSPTPEEPEHFNSPTATDAPMPLAERLRSRASIDDSSNLRWNAFLFYTGILIDHPTGLGTGFTNKFVTGPHNSFLKLAVDNSILAALLLVVVLGGVTWRAFKIRSPQLISLSLIAWVAAMFHHTIMVDPIVVPALAIGLGFSSRQADPRDSSQ
jgi:hypothetical protein